MGKNNYVGEQLEYMAYADSFKCQILTGCDTALRVGSIVVRNKEDWDHGNFYGGPDSKGVVVSLKELAKGSVKVEWENGESSYFKWGYNGKTEITIHCDGKYKFSKLIKILAYTFLDQLKMDC